MSSRFCATMPTFKMSVPRSWSLRPAAVTVKSTTSILALSSGLKCGFGSRVVQYSRKPSLTSTWMSRAGSCKAAKANFDLARRDVQITLIYCAKPFNDGWELGCVPLCRPAAQ